MKKLLAILLVICLLAASAVAFTACKKADTETADNGNIEGKNNEPATVDYSKLNVLYMGDSIAEAIAGPSPIEERAYYGYFGIVGEINGYQYQNRAISGHQTQELLGYVEREEEDAYVTQARIKEADVICISITGNDLLWHNFPLMMYEIAAKEKFGDDYVNQDVVKACYEYHRYQVIDNEGNMRTIAADDDLTAGDVRALVPGDGLATFNRCIATATKNVEDIVAALRKQNANATIIFQNVYNPVDNESEIIPVDLVSDLMALDPKYDFSTPAGVAEYRKKGAYMLGALSDLLESVAAKNDKVEFLDVAKVFDDIYNADMERGKALIFEDGVHPSDQGHAVIAATLQAKLVSLGLAEATQSLANYKALRKEQLTRLYGSVQGFDNAAAAARVDAATDMDGVTVAYFDAIEGYVPKLSADPTKDKPTNGVYVASKEVYTLSRVINRRGSKKDQKKIDDMLDLMDTLEVMKEKSLTLDTDGTMEIKIVLSVGDLLDLVGAAGVSFDGMVLGGIEDTFYKDEAGNLTNLKMSGAKDTFETISIYADALFPGIGFTDGTLGKNFHYIFDSLGLGIEGLDVLLDDPYVDEVGLPVDMAPAGTIDESTKGKRYDSYADYLVAYLGRYQEVVDADGKTLHVDKLPEGVTEKVLQLDVVTVRIRTTYSLTTVKGADGAEYQAIYCGVYQDRTAPWLVMTKYADKDGKEHVKMNIEVLGFVVQF